MPRHFLVKRHKHCNGTVSYRDRLLEGQEGTNNGNFTTTILDTDKISIIRDGDYISDYSGYGSPDSGYAASPNSANFGFARDKENFVTDRENNNNKNFVKTDVGAGFYDMTTTTTNMNTTDSIRYCINSDNDFQDADDSDYPMDLSMPSRKKAVLSSVPTYLQRNESYQTKYHNQQQQQQQHYHSNPSPNESVNTSSATAAVLRLDAFRKLYFNNIDGPLCAAMPSLSSNNFPFNTSNSQHSPRLDARVTIHYPGTLKTDHLLDIEAASRSEILSRSQSISVPSLKGGQRPLSSMSSSSSSSPPPTSAASQETTKHATLSQNMSSPLQSPNRKRGISCDNDEVSDDSYPQDLSKSLPAPKKNDNSNDPNTTPNTKTASSQKAKTTAPALKKSPGSVPSGKRLKAVRRLNFDIDTTSPVSGTIIKDAADFHPDDGKVVYGDIEPSFNFVEVTPEARAELEKIENKIGDYICQLCKEFYEDAFQLAQHRCSRIIHVEYRCPECEKVFNCPANLASHRRWHKPRVPGQTKLGGNAASKILPAVHKIAPKPDCNGNMADSLPETKIRMAGTPDICNTSTDNNLITDEFSSISNNVKKVEPSLYKNSFSAKAFGNGKVSPVLKNLELLPKTSNLPNDSDNQEKGPSAYVSVMHTVESPYETDVKDSANTTSTPETSATGQDSYSRQDTVIAVNPLRTILPTYGSSLTTEERTLVLQVLNSHNRQHQNPSPTATVSPRISDTRASPLNFTMKPIETQRATVDNEAHLRSIVCDDNDSLHSSSSPPMHNLITPRVNHKLLIQLQQHHVALSEQQVKPQIGCYICGKKFQRQAYLRKHILSQHGKRNGSSKTEVSAAFDSMGEDHNSFGNQCPTDKDHQQSDNNNSSVCRVCGKGFNSDATRIKHESLAHGLSNTHTCGICDMTFASKAALDKHSRYAHTTETFSCKYCNSTFHSSPGLTRHINKCHPTENRRVILLQLPASRTC